MEHPMQNIETKTILVTNKAEMALLPFITSTFCVSCPALLWPIRCTPNTQNVTVYLEFLLSNSLYRLPTLDGVADLRCPEICKKKAFLQNEKMQSIRANFIFFI